MFLSFRRQAEKAALPCKLRKTTTKTTKLVICYQSNAWRRYSQILIWKCIFPFSSLTRCSHIKADSTVMDLLSAEIWRKSLEKETTAWTSYFKDPFCVFPTTTATFPSGKILIHLRFKLDSFLGGGREKNLETRSKFERTGWEWLKVRWKGGAETCNCCKTRLATSQPLISSQKRAKRAWMRLRRITNQETKITGLLESLRRNELNCHVVPVLQKNVRLL